MSATSEIQKRASSEELADQNIGSVYDFLYYDARRVGSFLSQFDDSGLLQGFSRKEGRQANHVDGAEMEASGGLPAIAKGRAKYLNTATTGKIEEASSTYDPYWINALTLLDVLQEHGMLSTNVSECRIGHLALFTGSLKIRDMRLIQKALALPSMKGALGKGDESGTSRQVRRQQVRKGTEIASTEFGLELFSLLPHAVQLEVSAEGASVWATLQEESMVVSSSDLFLKHGIDVPGDWYVLGVVDALPTMPNDPFSALSQYAQASQNLGAIGNGGVDFGTHGFAALIDAVVPFAKILIGRRESQFGATPLLIFRKVSDLRPVGTT
ncbi:hypothetical protein [Shinella sp. HZN7]|uniref:hypothetical protein n=1 Tax=Shinella sp. (strain HZN7) TaxID=879274 RepID=UPI0007DA9D04|nr:hypothetical protein [Shinella sp. HZN7]ANH04590.1 hypothetical protein shn_11450 [Shinella sp. HZN7]